MMLRRNISFCLHPQLCENIQRFPYIEISEIYLLDVDMYFGAKEIAANDDAIEYRKIA